MLAVAGETLFTFHNHILQPRYTAQSSEDRLPASASPAARADGPDGILTPRGEGRWSECFSKVRFIS